MELYLIRHAESTNNARPSYQRVEDPDITPVGRQQARHLADWIATLRIDRFITSPFRRTLQTAAEILGRTQHSLEIWHDVFERGGCFRGHNEANFAGASGMGRSQIVHLLGPHGARCEIDPSIDENGWWGGKDRESDSQAVTRARAVCRRVKDSFPNGEVVVLLIHADFKRLLLKEMMGDQLQVDRLGNIRNAAISKINRIGAQWQLDYFNSVTHLPARLITGNEH